MMQAWREVHERVRRIRRDRAALDHAELSVLRDVEKHRVWTQLSYGTLLEYLEAELGYGARAAYDRLRVAYELAALPLLDAAFAKGERCFTAVRELTRVATPETEGKWLAWSAGKSLRDIERGVVGRAKGMLPEDPIDHEALVEDLRYSVTGATAALVRQARQVMCTERGSVPEDDEFLAALAHAFLDGSGREDKPAYQIAVTTCESCAKGWQTGAGVEFPISASAVERAKSDALVIGSIDGLVPDRAKHVVPPAVRRMVHARDGHRCRVPGCTASAHLEIAHVDGIAASGKIDNRPGNLLTICDAHHVAQHDGRLRIGRVAGEVMIERLEHPAPARVKAAARDALMWRGYGPRQAAEVVGRVVGAREFAHVDKMEDVVGLVVEEAVAALERSAGAVAPT